jgi:hypothetical protein
MSTGAPSEPISPSLVAQLKACMAADPGASTRAELEGLLAERDADALRSRFDHPLSFGTSGLRGPLVAGPVLFYEVAEIRSRAYALVDRLRDAVAARCEGLRLSSA